MGSKNAVGGEWQKPVKGKKNVGGKKINKKMQLFPRNILYWFHPLRSYSSIIDFRRYILGFRVAIYFHKNSSAYAVGGIVARIDAVHGINSIPAWDG